MTTKTGMIFFVFIACFLPFQTSLAQSYSLVSTLHQTRYRSLETNYLQNQSYNDASVNLQDIELGLYLTKNNTIYFVSYELKYEFSEHIENRPNISTTYHNLIHPRYHHKLRTGVGTRHSLNRKTHSLIYAFLTYGWEKGQGTEFITYVQGKISQRQLSESAKSKYIDLGIKVAIEYDLSNRWTFGIELNSYLFLRFVKANTFAANEKYDVQGNLSDVFKYEAEHKDFDLQSNLFRPALYLKFNF